MLHAYLERWPNLNGSNGPDQSTVPRSHDPVRGLSHALSLLEVNMIMVKAAQVGFGVTAFEAVCEMPRHREMAEREIRALTSAIADIRRGAASRSRADDDVEAAREATMGRISARVMHDLAELETQLICIDLFRKVIPADPAQALVFTQATQIAALYESVFGRAPDIDKINDFKRLQYLEDHEDTSDERRLRNRFNPLGAGPFFSRRSLRDGRSPLYADIEQVMKRGELDSRKEPGVHGRQGTHPAEPGRASFGRFEILEEHYRHAWMRPYYRWELTLPENERSRYHSNPWELVRRWAAEDLVRRQEVMPVSTTLMRSLLHSSIWRCWERDSLMPFRKFGLKDGVLVPKTDRSGQSLTPKITIDFLNRVTAPSAKPDITPYKAPFPVLINVDEPDRFARIRFIPEEFSRGQMFHFTLVYEIKDAGGSANDGCGTLSSILAVMDHLGLHVEHIDNSVYSYNEPSPADGTGCESGAIKLIFRAVTTAAADMLRQDAAGRSGDSSFPNTRELLRSAVEKLTDGRVQVTDVNTIGWGVDGLYE